MTSEVPKPAPTVQLVHEPLNIPVRLVQAAAPTLLSPAQPALGAAAQHASATASAQHNPVPQTQPGRPNSAATHSVASATTPGQAQHVPTGSQAQAQQPAYQAAHTAAAGPPASPGASMGLAYALAQQPRSPVPAASLPQHSGVQLAIQPPVWSGQEQIWKQETGDANNETDPAVFTVADRKVKGDVGDAATPLYVLVRRWIQNDPDLFEDHGSLSQPSMLPPLPPVAEAADDDASSPPLQPPVDLQRSQQHMPIEALLRRHQQHWSKVRKYHAAKNQARIARHKQRLSVLLPLM